MNNQISSRSKINKEIEVIYLTAEENPCKNDSNNNNAYPDINSLYPDIISRSTKIFSAENEKNERPLQKEINQIQERDLEKGFLSRKRKRSDIFNISKISNKSNKIINSKNENEYKIIHRKLTRSNYDETLKNDEGLQSLVNLVLPDKYKKVKDHKKNKNK